MASQLKILKVHNHGNSREERVLIEVLEDCDLSEYALIDSTFDEDGKISNKNRHIFWFPTHDVSTGDFVSLRTGKGKDKIYTNDSDKVVHRFHWGLDTPVWNDDGDAATLIQISDWISKQVK